MSQQASETDSFFDDSVRSGAPSIKLSDKNDGVMGEIVDQFKVPKKKFASDEIETDRKTGQEILQLVVIVQTTFRNWDRVAKIPLVDYSDPRSAQKDPSEDDGKRAIYIAPYTNLHAAVGKATAATNGGKPCGLRNGATFGVKVADLEDVGKGNPKRVFEAKYVPPATSGSDGFFNPEQSQGGPNDVATRPAAPIQQQAPVQQDPFATAAPAAPAQQAPTQQVAPAAQTDPWGAPSTSGEPPF